MQSQTPNPIVAALLEPLPSLVQGRIDLGDQNVVELLVRGFIDHSLAAFQRVLRGEQDDDSAIDGINAQAIALNTVFLGQSGFPEVIVHPWNTAEQLGAFLQDTVQLEYPEDDCVRALLIHLATQVMHALRLPEDQRQEEIEALTLDATDLLLGRAPQDDEDAEVIIG
ncbi:hypothetical protein [Azospirillum thermophilum]|uniref:Uncharacterized protein n=1 Tax=Azospirillum thermophilum TaxID=2202148 RepID=A0A2S2CR55_9PROT|nr:hypothetical protein [Azospirillum thermophilum]AWK86905.1 hypothetical protein DEW08_12305 [Azospirillum thermophilum]